MIIKINTNFGDEVKNIRLNHYEKGIELSKALGISCSELSLIEHNKYRPSFSFIEKFSEHYGLNYEQEKSLRILAYSDVLSDIFDIPKDKVWYVFRNFFPKDAA